MVGIRAAEGTDGEESGLGTKKIPQLIGVWDVWTDGIDRRSNELGHLGRREGQGKKRKEWGFTK